MRTPPITSSTVHVQDCKVCNNSVTTSASLYAGVTNENPVINQNLSFGVISIISSRARGNKLIGRFVTESSPLPGPGAVRTDWHCVHGWGASGGSWGNG